MRPNLNRKYIGDKKYNQYSVNYETKISVVTSSEYRTKGEDIILIKDVDNCKLMLDSTTTSNVVIKTMVKTIIIPLMNKIDDEFDEIIIDKGACVEFYNIENGWYILSSDGLKLK
jgi:hypothetical protein